MYKEMSSLNMKDDEATLAEEEELAKDEERDPLNEVSSIQLTQVFFFFLSFSF